MLRRAKVLLLITILLSITTSGIVHTETVSAQELDNREPGDEITGTLSPSHISATYGFTIDEPGVYRLILNVTNDASLFSSVKRYSRGRADTIAICYSDEFEEFIVQPGSLYVGSIYQVYVKSDDFAGADSADYRIVIEKSEPIVVADGQEYSLIFNRFANQHFILHVDESNSAYEIQFSSLHYSTYLEIIDSQGLQVTRRSSSATPSERHPVVLNPGDYHIFLNTYSSIITAATLQFDRIHIPFLIPGTSVELELSSGLPYQYVQVAISEGVPYSINLDPHSDIDVRFSVIVRSIYGPLFNMWGEGETENVTDLTFWDCNLAYTDWDLGPDMQYSRSRPEMTGYSSSYRVPYSSFLISAFSWSAGNATLSLDAGSEASVITPDILISENFDGVEGPFWKIFKMTGFSSMNLYKFHLEHFPATDSILEPRYSIYSPRTTDQSYLFITRPHLTELERESWDKTRAFTQSLSYNEYLQINDAYYYNSNDGERWLYISILDGYGSAGFASEINSGNIQFQASVIEQMQASIDNSISVAPSPSTAIYSLQLERGCTYQIEVSATYLQSSGTISIWNATGHQLSSYQYTLHDSNRFSEYYLFEVECTGPHAMIVKVAGDSPIIIDITEFREGNTGIQLPFMIGSLAVAVAEGIILGIVIGKLKFRKNNAT